MAERKSEDLIELNKLQVFRETHTLTELHKMVTRVTNNQEKRSLEQKIIALKILMLNDMQYKKTAEETGVTKKTLWLWWKQYGNMMTVVNPSEEIAIQLENNLAGLMNDVYECSRVVAKKMKELAEKANSVKDLRSVSDSLRAYAELIKIENQGKAGAGGEGQVNNFYTQINEMMVQNQFKNDGDKN
jgi:transposase-like protein